MKVRKNSTDAKEVQYLELPKPITKPEKYREFDNSTNDQKNVCNVRPEDELMKNSRNLSSPKRPNLNLEAKDKKNISSEKMDDFTENNQKVREVADCESTPPLLLNSEALKEIKCVERHSSFEGANKQFNEQPDLISEVSKDDCSNGFKKSHIDSSNLDQNIAFIENGLLTNIESEFNELRPVLKSLLIDNRVYHKDIFLSLEEAKILRAVIQKKISLRLPDKYVYESTEMHINPKQIPKRRIEENYKFVLKLTYKYLQIRYMGSEAYKRRKAEGGRLIHEFYAYYFGEFALRESIDLANFYLPLTSDCKEINVNKVVAKTINSTYVALIAKNPQFYKDFTEYLQNDFLRDYESLINKRIDKLVNKWENLYIREHSSYKSINNICDFIVQNKKSKLPWFYSEAQQAVHIVLHTFKKNAKYNRRRQNE